MKSYFRMDDGSRVNNEIQGKGKKFVNMHVKVVLVKIFVKANYSEDKF